MKNLFFIALVIGAVYLFIGEPESPGVASTAEPTGAVSQSTVIPSTSSGDEQLSRAFTQRQTNLQVQGSGVVQRVLSDDNSGSRHQRFILQLASGQTLLVAHNIDLAERIPGIGAGDRVEFFGEYEWNAEGGVMHWTHHDPQGRHVAGCVMVVERISRMLRNCLSRFN